MACARAFGSLCTTVEISTDSSTDGLTFGTSCSLIVNNQCFQMCLIHNQYYCGWIRHIQKHWLLTIKSHMMYQKNRHILVFLLHRNPTKIYIKLIEKTHWQTDTCVHKTRDIAPPKTGTCHLRVAVMETAETEVFCPHQVTQNGTFGACMCTLVHTQWIKFCSSAKNLLLARSSFRQSKIGNFGTNWSVCQPFFEQILRRLWYRFYGNRKKHVCNLMSL